MGRRKIKIQYQPDEGKRKVFNQLVLIYGIQILFNKRKNGILKKGAELSRLCGLEMIILFKDLEGNQIKFFSQENSLNNFMHMKYKKLISFTMNDYPHFFDNLNPKILRKRKKQEQIKANISFQKQKVEKKIKIAQVLTQLQKQKLIQPEIKPNFYRNPLSLISEDLSMKPKRILTRSRSKIFSEYVMNKKASEIEGKALKQQFIWKDDIFSLNNRGYTNISYNNEKVPNFNYCDLYDDVKPEVENQFSFGANSIKAEQKSQSTQKLLKLGKKVKEKKKKRRKRVLHRSKTRMLPKQKESKRQRFKIKRSSTLNL